MPRLEAFKGRRSPHHPLFPYKVKYWRAKTKIYHYRHVNESQILEKLVDYENERKNVLKLSSGVLSLEAF